MVYRHVISLGHFCRTALELRRYGLRDGSYPLDWNISPLDAAVGLVESDFEDFLELDQLERDPERPEVVYDKGSGIALHNDFDPVRPLPEQYRAVRETYERRIERFREAITEPTLFVRYLADAGECRYLDDHGGRVMAALRKSEPRNDLLLVGGQDLPETCGGLEVYRVARDQDGQVGPFVARNAALRHRLLTLDYPLRSRLVNLARYWLLWLRQWAAVGTRVRRGRSLLRTAAARPRRGVPRPRRL